MSRYPSPASVKGWHGSTWKPNRFRRRPPATASCCRWSAKRIVARTLAAEWRRCCSVNPATSVVLRTVWRVKKRPLGASGNIRPDYQQLLTDVRLVIWVHSSDEASDRLEDRVSAALTNPRSITRFGGLSLGESTHVVDEVCLLDRVRDRLAPSGRAFLVAPKGRLTLPVWVDHVGSAGTRYATGNLEDSPLDPPPIERMPRISPE